MARALRSKLMEGLKKTKAKLQWKFRGICLHIWLLWHTSVQLVMWKTVSAHFFPDRFLGSGSLQSSEDPWKPGHACSSFICKFSDASSASQNSLEMKTITQKYVQFLSFVLKERKNRNASWGPESTTVHSIHEVDNSWVSAVDNSWAGGLQKKIITVISMTWDIISMHRIWRTRISDKMLWKAWSLFPVRLIVLYLYLYLE